MTTVYISLKQRDNADNEWHTGLLHTGVFYQLGSGSHSKGEVSVHLSRRSPLGSLVEIKDRYKTLCLNKKHAAGINDQD